jgi:hypothetical protein
VGSRRAGEQVGTPSHKVEIDGVPSLQRYYLGGQTWGPRVLELSGRGPRVATACRTPAGIAAERSACSEGVTVVASAGRAPPAVVDSGTALACVCKRQAQRCRPSQWAPRRKGNTDFTSDAQCTRTSPPRSCFRTAMIAEKGAATPDLPSSTPTSASVKPVASTKRRAAAVMSSAATPASFMAPRTTNGAVAPGGTGTCQ